MRHNWKRLIAAYVLTPAIGTLVWAFGFSIYQSILHGEFNGFFPVVLLSGYIVGVFAYAALIIAIPLSVMLTRYKVTHVVAYIALGVFPGLIFAILISAGTTMRGFIEIFCIVAVPMGAVCGLFFWWFYVRYMLKQTKVAS